MKKAVVAVVVILIVVLLACCLAGGGYLIYRRYQQKQSTQGFKDVWNQYLTANNKINTKIDEFAKLEQERNDLVDKLDKAAEAGDDTEVLKIVDDIEDNVDKEQKVVDEINTAILSENGLVMQLATESAKVEPATLKISAANLAAKTAEGNSLEMEYRALLQTSVDIDRRFIITYRDMANSVITADEFKTQNDADNAELDTNNTARKDKANEYRALRDEIRRQWASIQKKI